MGLLDAPLESTLPDLHERAPGVVGPQVLVVVPALPRTNGTGKLQRVGYADKLGLPMIADLEKYTYHVEENGALRRVR